MSPPIRDGSGNSIGSIRLGDGTEISEVRTGAGDVLFNAIPDSVIDNFEKILYEDKGNTLSDYYRNDVSDFVRKQTTVIEGSHSLKLDGSSGTVMHSEQGDGLPNYPENGDTFACFVQSKSGGAEMEVGFGCEGMRQDTYYCGVNVPNDEFRLNKQTSGSFTQLDATSVSLSNGEWHDVEIEWDGTSITGTLYDVSGGERDSQIAQVSGTDSDHQNRVGIGFGAGKNAVHVWDNFRIGGDSGN